MKKIISIILAVVMVMAMSVTAFAYDGQVTLTTAALDDGASSGNQGDNGQYTIDIPAQYNATGLTTSGDAPTVSDSDATKPDSVYYVEMYWDVTSTLTYTVDDGNYKWTVYNNSDTLIDDNKLNQNGNATGSAAAAKYVLDQTNGDWSGTAFVNVNIKNWSNVPVYATVSYADVSTVTGAITEAITSSNSITNAAPTVDSSNNITTTNGTALSGQQTLAAPVSGSEQAASGWLTTTPTTLDAYVNITAVTNGAINADNTAIGTVTVQLASSNS